MFLYQQTFEGCRYFVSIVLCAYSNPCLRSQGRKEFSRAHSHQGFYTMSCGCEEEKGTNCILPASFQGYRRCRTSGG